MPGEISNEWLKSALYEVQQKYPTFQESLKGKIPNSIGRDIGACDCNTEAELLAQAQKALNKYKEQLGKNYQTVKDKGYTDKDIFIGTSLYGAKGFVRKAKAGKAEIAPRSEQANIKALNTVHVLDSLATAHVPSPVTTQNPTDSTSVKQDAETKTQTQSETNSKTLDPAHEQLKGQWGWTGIEDKTKLESVDRAYYNSLWSWSGVGNYGKIGAVDALNAWQNGGGVLAQAQRTKFFAGSEAILNMGLAAAAFYNSYDRTEKLSGKVKGKKGVSEDTRQAQLSELQASAWGSGGAHVGVFLGTGVLLPQLIANLNNPKDAAQGLGWKKKIMPGYWLSYPSLLASRAIKKWGSPEKALKFLTRINPTAARANVYAYSASLLGAGLIYHANRDKSQISTSDYLKELGVVAATNSTFTFTGWAVALNQEQNDGKALLGYHDNQHGHVRGLKELSDQWRNGALHLENNFTASSADELVGKLATQAEKDELSTLFKNGKLNSAQIHPELFDMIPKAQRANALKALADGTIPDLSFQSVEQAIGKFNPVRLVTGFERTVPFLEKSLPDARFASKLLIAAGTIRATLQAYKKYSLATKSLNDMLKNGQITQAEYDAKIKDTKYNAYKEAGSGTVGAFGGGWALAFLSRHAQPDAAAGRLPWLVRTPIQLGEKFVGTFTKKNTALVSTWLQNKATDLFMIKSGAKANIAKKFFNWMWTSQGVRGSLGITAVGFIANGLIDYWSRKGIDKGVEIFGSKK